mgnify:CR=1 FL=1
MEKDSNGISGFFRGIVQGKVNIIQGNAVKEAAVDLIKQILVKDTRKRLGFGPDGYKQLRNHPFFKNIDWEK